MGRTGIWVFVNVGFALGGGLARAELHLPTPAAYAQLPLSFEANRGQAASLVKFLARGPGYSLFLTATEAVLALGQGKERTSALRLKFLNAHPAPRITGREELPGKSNYFIGNDPARWHTNIPTYAKVEYQAVYPGVDLVYYGNRKGLEYDLVLAPGAEPERIRLAVEGAEKLEADAQGDLLVQCRGETLRWRAPRMYQVKNGILQEVEGGYRLRKNHVGFRVGSYDRSQSLVIDPVLAFSTYLGPSELRYATAIAADSSGNTYVTGAANGAFVLKLNASGTAVLYTAYLRGTALDVSRGIAVDPSGNAYVTGYTSSPDFPLANPSQGTLGGLSDAFVAELSSSGSTLLFSTYLGGSGADMGQAIAADASGNVYVTGSTNSPNFPTTRALQTSLGGAGRFQQGDAFVARLNTVSTTLVYSTYLGGSDDDAGSGIAIDAAGSAYITGVTFSRNFPTAKSLQDSYRGGNILGGDAFIAKLTPEGSSLVYSTYLGGSGDDSGSAITVDVSGNAYVTGATASEDFPTVRPLQGALASPQDAFVTKVNAAGSALVFSTYLDGPRDRMTTATDSGAGIALDATGNIYIAGTTTSSSFPLVNPAQGLFGGGFCSSNPFSKIFFPCPDTFVVKLNPSASAILYSTYLGGSSSESAAGIALDSTGNVYVAGSTNSADFPTLNAVQPTFPNLYSSFSGSPFVAKLSDPGVVCAYTVTVASQSFTGDKGTGTVTVTTPSGCVWRAVANAPWLTITPGGYRAASGTVTFSVAGNSSPSSRSGTLTIAGQTVTITQAGAAPGCTYAISPTSQSVEYSAGTSGVTVTAPQGCGWEATSNADWIAVTSLKGSGSGAVYFTYQRNGRGPGSTQTGTLTIAGLTFTLTQAGDNIDQTSFEPVLRRALPAGFYIVEATLAPGARGGFWGLEVLASKGQSAGGFNLGGAVFGPISNVGFGAFLLSTPQKVTATLDAQTLPGIALLMQLFDSQHKRVGGFAQGPPPLTLSLDLQPGFYIVEVTGGGLFPFTFQLGLAADFFVGGLDTGGYVGPGISGFGAFYLPEAQDVTLKLYGRNTYGNNLGGGFGAGSLILTLKDSNRNVLQVVGP